MPALSNNVPETKMIKTVKKLKTIAKRQKLKSWRVVTTGVIRNPVDVDKFDTIHVRLEWDN